MGAPDCLVGGVLNTEHEVEKQDEAGESHVAVLSVAPWEGYVQRLQPDEFSIDPATELDQSMPVNVQMDKRLLAVLGLKFSASSPQLAKTYTETDKILEGEPKTTKESKRVHYRRSFQGAYRRPAGGQKRT